ncbi:MAG: hypothetical protein ACTSWY_07320 [Promethearchaeota archaeon]
MKCKKVFVLNPSQSRRLIAKGVVTLPQVKSALKSGKIFVCRGSTNAFVLEELYKEVGLDESVSKADFVSGQIIPGDNFMKWWINPAADKKIKEIIFENGIKREIEDGERVKELGMFKKGDIFIKGGNLIDINGIPGVLVAGPGGGTIGSSQGTIQMKGIEVICPIGLEKIIMSDVLEIQTLLGQTQLDPTSEGLSCGIIPMPFAVTITEMEALETLFNCEAYHVASGGVGGAEGSVSILVDCFGDEENFTKLNKFMEEIGNETIYKPNI